MSCCGRVNGAKSSVSSSKARWWSCREGCPIAWLRHGEHFGEFSLLRAVPSPVTLLAETPVTVAVVTGPEFRGTIADNGPMRARIEHELDQRITHWLRSVRRQEPAAHATG